MAVNWEIFNFCARLTIFEESMPFHSSSPPGDTKYPNGRRHPLIALSSHSSLPTNTVCLPPSPHPKAGCFLGLGVGISAAFVIAKVNALLGSGELTNIVCALTLKQINEHATSLNIPLWIPTPVSILQLTDLTRLTLTSGCGSTLLREQMVEAALDKFIVAIDDSKLAFGLSGIVWRCCRQ